MMLNFIILIVLASFIYDSAYGLCKLGDRVKPSVDPYEVTLRNETTVNCIDFYTVSSEETCQSIYNRHRIEEFVFMKLNPDLDCSKPLSVNQKVCLGDGKTGCLTFKTVAYSYDTCEKIASFLGISVITLKAINPGLDCSEIRMSIFCAEATNPPCKNLYQVQNGDSINSILSHNNLTDDEFYFVNPYATPSHLIAGSYVCISKKPSSPSIQSLHEVIQMIAKGDLALSFQKYLDNPIETNFNEFNTVLQDSLNHADIKEELKRLESASPILNEFYQSMGIDKSEVCIKMQNSMYTKSRDCFCAGEPVMLCTKILQEEMHEFLSKNGASIVSRINTARRKRAATAGSCGFGYNIQDKCGSFECCQIYTIAEICVGGEGCLLPDPFAELENYGNPNYRLNSFFGLYGKLCIAFIKELLEQSHVDQLINWDGCVAKTSIKILPIRSQVLVEMEMNFLFYKLVITFKLQYERPLPRCSDKSHYCDFDYCFAHPGSMSFDIAFNVWRLVTYDNIWTFIIAEPTCDISKFNDTTGFTPEIVINPTIKYNPNYEACYKSSYGNGAGLTLNSCPDGKELQDLLCYDRCRENFHSVSFLCHESCRSGYTDGGIFCYTGVHIYGKGCCCTVFGCCGCPSGYIDDGCFCRNPGHSYLKGPAYSRGVGIPMVCSANQYQSGGLCYPRCADNYYGEGPVCWQSCQGSFSYNCGAFCTKDSESCARVSLLAATSPLGFVHEVCK